MYRMLPIILASALTVSAYADETTVSKWKGEAELGYLRTSGNTDTESLHVSGKVVNERDKWRHTGTVESIVKDENGVNTANKFYVTGKSDYSINKRSYLFVFLTYENDHFSGYDYQAGASFGYGYHLIKTETQKLDLEAGVGARKSRTDAGDTTTEGIVRGAGNYEWKISKTATFLQTLAVESGKDSTVTRSTTALKTQVAGNLSAKFALNVKHASQVPAGFKNTDTETIVTLVYNFE